MPDTLPILYSYRRCPYAMRARMALHSAGEAVELREIQLRAKPAALLQASPKGTVPVLVLADGAVLEQSLDIMRWALARHDPQGWLAPGAACEPWIARNDEQFKPLLDRYKYPGRFPAASQLQHRQQAEALMLAPLEQCLRASPWLLGARASLADMALLPFVRQFAAVDAAWFAQCEYAALRAWLQRWLDSALFAAVMVKQPVWQAS